MMKMDFFSRCGRSKIWHRWIALLVCAVTVLSLVNIPMLMEAAEPNAGTATRPRDVLFYGTVDVTNLRNSNTMHFLIRHWHAEQDPAGETVKDSYTVVVEGYIVPGNGNSYTCYARAYSAVREGTTTGTYTGFTEVTANTQSAYIAIENDKISLFANPYYVETASNTKEYLERFAGFSVSAGQTAVTLEYGNTNNHNDGAKLIIDPSKAGQIHLVKSHLFYVSELVTVDGSTQIVGENGSTKDFPAYRDTYTDGDAKYYNSKSGLHTDKTASVTGSDGRTFNLDLESWFIDGDPINIGMILDASGSMAFTADTPQPIKLTDAQISSLGINKLSTKITTATQWNNYFLNNNKLNSILNINNTDNSRLGSSGYAYYIYDPRGNTAEFVPLGYWGGTYSGNIAKNGNNVLGILNNSALQKSGMAGWYYINPGSSWDNYFGESIQSGKTLNGILSGYTIEDVLPNNPKGVSAPGGGTGSAYYSSDASPTKFYVDKDGYLRCFYFVNKNGQDNGYGASYVYELPDEGYIKVEALQRALGSFVTELEAKSPESMISAVRFSTDKTPSTALDKLVLLDWTANVQDAQQMLSLQYGAKDNGDNNLGGTTAGDKSTYLAGKYGMSVIEQYNYGLTGGTNTQFGLKAFREQLHGRLNTYLEKAKKQNSKKFIILFTDGKDSTLEGNGNDPTKTESYPLANALKEAGYTIYCVMLTGGPVFYGSDDFNNAKKFLTALAGSKKDDPNAENYVFTTEDPEIKAMGGNSVDALSYIFTEALLPQMLNSLETYDVQDYIDPRFDLVDADGTVWHLNANGSVECIKSDGSKETLKLTKTNGKEIIFAKDDSSAETVLSATLYYDGDPNANMYYLRWTDQIIPGSPEGASKLPVWHAKVTIRAKDDFIGGNSVLSNGNGEKENFVHAQEKSGDQVSSGIDKSEGNKAARPSKGFPRTTVNVGPGDTNVDRTQLIYMGEDLSFRDVAMDLIGQAKEASEGSHAYYYWEYLERYVEYYNKHSDTVDLPEGVELTDGVLKLEDLIDAIIKSDGKLQIPYYYLPNKEESNQTGTSSHEADCLGYLTYTFKTEDVFPDGETEDTDTKSCDVNVTFTPFTEEERKELDDDGKDANGRLVQENKDGEPVYPWDSDYKGEAGDPTTEQEIKGDHTTELVSGDIAMQVELSATDIAALKAAGVTQITYTADLIRHYGDHDGEVVGTFTAVIEIDEIGGVLQTATVEYSSAYREYVTKYGLPIGTYTLGNCGHTFTYSGAAPVTEPFTFYAPGVVDDENEYNKDIFGLEMVIGHNTPEDYLAKLGDTTVELGGEPGGNKAYTDARFGLFRVGGYPSGELELEKTVSGFGDKKKAFEFTVELILPANMEPLPLPDGTGEGYPYDGVSNVDGVEAPAGGWLKLTHVQGNTYTATIQLKHGQGIVIRDLPTGTQYTITEKVPGGYAKPEAKGEIGVVETGKRNESSFQNIPMALTIIKTVKGGADNTLFTFRVTLTLPDGERPQTLPDSTEVGFPYVIVSDDEDIEGWLVLTHVQGNTYVGEVQLKGGQSVMIKDLPNNTEYMVEEIDIPGNYVFESATDADGNSTTDTQVRGTFTGNAKVEFFNAPLNEMPATGGMGTGIFTLIGTALLLFAAAWLGFCAWHKARQN